MARPTKTGGKKTNGKGRKASPARGRKAAKTEGGRTTKRHKGRSVSELEAQLKLKTRELEEALAQQTATGDVLKVISRSAFDLDSVMNTLAHSAAELCAASLCGLYIREGDFLACWGFTGISKEQEEFVRRTRVPVDDTNFVMNRVLSSGEIANIGDFDNDPSVGTRAFQEKLGFKALLIVPLMREGHGIGLFVLGRPHLGQFSQRHVELVQTFADQAVIAIENTRLFNETTEALERQTATADILKVIASSPDDVQPVFDAIASSARRLIGGFSTSVHLVVDDMVHLVAFTPTTPESDAILVAAHPRHRSEVGAVALVEHGEIAQIADSETADAHTRQVGRARGWRGLTLTPLMNQGKFIGFIASTRLETGVLGNHHVELLRTFADQAVIAIVNARLFNEVQAKTRDLAESLEHQTATSEVLQVISSSMADSQPVFERILDIMHRLFDWKDSAIFLAPGDGLLHLAARRGDGNEALDHVYPRPIGETSAPLVIEQRRQVYYPDVMNGANVPESLRRASRATENFSVVLTPMLWDGQGVGLIGVSREPNVAFNEKELGMLRTFAEQAVIAIQNARLFNEVQTKSRDLQETLRYQTGSANILNVIASSPTDVEPVLKALVESACELCEAHDAVVLLKDGDELCFSAHHGPVPIKTNRWPIGRGWASGRAVVDRATVHVHDIHAEDEFTDGRELSRRAGSTAVRSILAAPLLREGESIGAILLRRQEVRPFNDKQISMLQTFADQAVIAIENARLFNETQAALERQTATSDILKVIASSPSNVQPVFEAIAASSNRLLDGVSTAVFHYRDNTAYLVAFTPTTPEADAILRSSFPRPIAGFAAFRNTKKGALAQIHDTEIGSEAETKRIARARGYRSMLFAPLMNKDVSIGVISVTRAEPGAFAPEDEQLLQTFADQAVIAIGNTELFNEVEQRTLELAKSLDELRAAQDRLIQTEKLASLGQLTAGIAHEIKNPLNFVNNFAALSAELTEELREVLAPAPLNEKIRVDVDELTGLLTSNLEKVVQHGKRADSIVKNMLQHSRESSGERRSVDINTLVEESLNLAYHGARAEKQDFAITLKQDLASDAGAIELYPQEMTRALLNLISNGFYAATSRQAENGGCTFEPMLSAATTNLGKTVEIRIRDNGTGIPPEVRAKMFNPFFTTKPTGEGTGLGLSMAHDIIVKQHGGRIDVETEPGVFTEFIITLPRESGRVA